MPFHRLRPARRLPPPRSRQGDATRGACAVPPGKPGESGAALIIAIFVLAILLSLVVSLSASVRVDLKASRNYAQTVQSDAILDGALAHGMAALQNDLDTGQDALTDDWALLGDTGMTNYPLGEGAYQIQILDASSRLNVNTATRDQLLLIPGLTEEMADAIIDWRDEDDTPGASGAESDVYESYPRPYRAKNAPFDTLDELRMVQGFTPSILYGQPTQEAVVEDVSSTVSTQNGLADLFTVRSYERNQTATGEARLRLSEVNQEQLEDLTEVTLTQQQIQAIVQHREDDQYESVADLLDVRIRQEQGQGPLALNQEQVRSLVDRFTVSGAQSLEGRINVNTAPLEVLMTLPQMTDEAANAIVSQRPFETIGDLLDDAVMPVSLFRSVVNRVSTKSSIYLIRVRGVAHRTGIVKAAEALVERTPEGTIRLLRRREVGRWPGWASWGWGEPAETLVVEEQ